MANALRIISITTLGIALGASSGFAQIADASRIGAVNVSYVARSSKTGKIALAKIEEATKKREAEVLAKASELEKQQTALQRGSALSARALADLQRAFDKSRIEFERFQQDARAELEALQNEFNAEFRVKLTPVIDAISKEKGLHFVFGLEQAAIVWWSPSVDISDEVVKRLDAGK